MRLPSPSYSPLKAPPVVPTKCVTHTGGLERALLPGIHGHHLLLPALALVSQQDAHGLTAPCMEGQRKGLGTVYRPSLKHLGVGGLGTVREAQTCNKNGQR